MQPLQNAITVRALGLIEDVKTAEPGRESESGQEQNRHRPRKIIDAAPGTGVELFVLKKTVVHLTENEKIPRFQAGRAVSNDEPHPQVRDAFGFTM